MKTPSLFQIVVIFAFGIAALVGLFVFANYQGISGGGKNAVGSLIIWGTLPQEAVTDTLQELSVSQSQFGKVTYVEKPETSFETDLADALASGTGPDLVVLSSEMLQNQKAKLQVIPFSAIPQRTYLNSFLPFFELFLTDDGTYGLPLALDPMVLYWNTAMLNAAGIVSPPSTWEAVAGLSQTLTKRTQSGGISQSCIAFGGYGNVHNARGILSALLLQSGTPIVDASGVSPRAVFADNVDTSFGATPAASAMSFYVQFSDPAKTLYSWNGSLPDSRTAFLSGDLALYPGYASERPYLSAANPNLSFDMAALPQPGTAEKRSTYGVGYVLAIPKASNNAAGALTTALALSADTPDATLAQKLSMAPARRAVLHADASDSYAAVFYPEALVAEGWLSPSPRKTDAIFSTMINDIASGRSGLEKALGAAAQAISASL